MQMPLPLLMLLVRNDFDRVHPTSIQRMPRRMASLLLGGVAQIEWRQRSHGLQPQRAGHVQGHSQRVDELQATEPVGGTGLTDGWVTTTTILHRMAAAS